MEINQVLQTKDGRIIGNAIVQSVEPLIIKTDYGNVLTGTIMSEVYDLWHIPDMSEWEGIESHKHYTSV